MSFPLIRYLINVIPTDQVPNHYHSYHFSIELIGQGRVLHMELNIVWTKTSLKQFSSAALSSYFCFAIIVVVIIFVCVFQACDDVRAGLSLSQHVSESRLSVSESVSEFFDAQEVLLSASSSDNEVRQDVILSASFSDNEVRQEVFLSASSSDNEMRQDVLLSAGFSDNEVRQEVFLSGSSSDNEVRQEFTGTVSGYTGYIFQSWLLIGQMAVGSSFWVGWQM